MRKIIGLTLVLVPVFSLASAAPAPRPAVGWAAHPFFSQTTDSDGRHEFYPAGESPEAWTERVIIETRDITAGTRADAVLDTVAAGLRERCAALKENRVGVAEDRAPALGILMWHCPRDDASGRGALGVVKLLVRNDRAYLMTAQGDYPPFEPEKSPLLRAQLERWSEFQRTFLFCDVLTHPGCAPDPDIVLNAPVAPLSDAELQLVQAAERRGREIFRQDQLAWRATDYVLERKLLPRKAREGAFIAIANDDQSGEVYFIRKRKLLRVDLDRTGTPVASEFLKSLPERIAMRHAALRTAEMKKDAACSPAINSVVLPAEDDDGWWVYLLSATLEPDVMVLGKHQRIRIDASATRVLSSESSTLGCFAIRIARDAATPDEPEPRWIGTVATHLVSDVPWETHVFQSLTFATSIYVITAQSVWHVMGGRVVKIDIGP